MTAIPQPDALAQTERTTLASHILSVASGLFFREGIRAVGVDRIILEADIAKATLYRHFRTKEDLVVAYLEARHAAVIEGMLEVLELFQSPRDQIAEIFHRLHLKAGNPEFRGCAFGLAVAEHGESARIIGIAQMHKSAVAEILDGIANQAGLRNPAQIGRHLALLYDGALARRAVFGSAQPMQDAKECALAVFDLAAQ